jgi:hypothetical protein
MSGKMPQTGKSIRAQPQKGNMGKYRQNKRLGCQMTYAKWTFFFDGGHPVV